MLESIITAHMKQWSMVGYKNFSKIYEPPQKVGDIKKFRTEELK